MLKLQTEFASWSVNQTRPLASSTAIPQDTREPFWCGDLELVGRPVGRAQLAYRVVGGKREPDVPLRVRGDRVRAASSTPPT